MTKRRKSLTKTVEFKKSLEDFLADEEGHVSKETILKVGLATVAGMGMLGALTGSFAATTHVNHSAHSNTVTNPVNITNACATYTPTHTNHPTHANTVHNSY
jgi:hypothetical protein